MSSQTFTYPEEAMQTLYMDREKLPLLDPSKLVPSLNPIVIVDGAGLDKAKDYFARVAERPRPIFVHDYEYNVTESRFYRRRARTLQFGDKDEQFVIDFLAFADGDTKKLIHGQGGYRHEGALLRMYTEDETSFEIAPVNRKTFQPIVDVIGPVLDTDAFLKIAHNAEAEYTTSKWCLGIRSWNFWDTQHMDRLLWNGLPAPKRNFLRLVDVVARRFKFLISKDEQKTFDLHSPLTENQIIYAALDVRLPFGLFNIQEYEIKFEGMEFTAQIENNAVPAFGDMHINGVWVNPTKWDARVQRDEADLATSLGKLDEHMLQVVGRKEYPDPERVAAAHAAFKACDDPAPEEVLLTERIKTIKKNPVLMAQLKAEREALRDERKERKTAAKEYHKSISHLATKYFLEEFEKKEGEADINYDSPDQVKQALLNGPFGLNESDLPDLDAGTTLLKLMHIPVVSDYVTFKQIQKRLGSYGYRWTTTSDQIAKGTKKKKGFVDPDTGRIHPPFRQLGTDTGRPSCADPNLLNVPSEQEFRGTFEARPGYDLVAKDCSGQELRILCDYSHEPSWVDAFNTDKDVHSISARLFRTVQWDSGALPNCSYFHDNFKKCKCPVHKVTRDRYKAVTLGVIMGKQAYSLAVEMGIPKEEAQGYIDEWFNQLQYNKEAITRNQEEAYANGEARTRSNRRRIIQEITLAQVTKRCDDKFGKGKWNQHQFKRTKEGMIAAVKREAGNVPYQGTGADLMKLAMGCGFDPDGQPYLWHILEPVFGALLLNYIYDEFVTESPEEQSEAVGGPGGKGGVVSDAIIRAGAQLVTIVPMASEGAIAKTWTK